MNVLKDNDFLTYLAELETQHGLQQGILPSLIYQESRGNPNAVGPVTKYGRARGLTQFIDETARQYGLLDDTGDRRTDPKAAAAAAARYLADLKKQWGSEKAALAGYNGGTAQARLVAAGEVPTYAETKDYVDQILGRIEAPGGAAPAAAKAPAPADEALPPDAGLRAAQGLWATLTAAGATPQEESDVQLERRQEEIRRQNVGVEDVFTEGLQDANVMGFATMDAVTGNIVREETPEDWDYWGTRDKYVAGLSDTEAEIMDEHAVSGPQGAQRGMHLIEEHRRHSKVYGEAGTLATLTGTVAASAFNIPSWAAGFGVVKAMSLAKVGASAMTAAGRARAAVGAMYLENVAGDMLSLAVDDAVGGQVSLQDYMLSPVMGAIMTLPFARGTYKAASANAVQKALDDYTTAHVSRDPTLDPAQRRAEIEKQVAEVVAERDTPTFTQPKMVPDDVDADIRAEILHEKAPEPPPTREDMTAKGELPEPPPPPAPKGPEGEIPKADTTELDFEQFMKHVHEGAAPDEGPDLSTRVNALVGHLNELHKAGDYSQTQALLADFATDPTLYGQLDQKQQRVMDMLLAEASASWEWKPGDPIPLGTIDGIPLELEMAVPSRSEGRQKVLSLGGSGPEAGIARTVMEATVEDVLDSMSRVGGVHGAKGGAARMVLAKHWLDLLRRWDDPALKGKVLFTLPRDKLDSGLYMPASNSSRVPAWSNNLLPVVPGNKGSPLEQLDRLMGRIGEHSHYTALHEITHQLTLTVYDAVKMHPTKFRPELRAAVASIDAQFEKFKAQVGSSPKDKGVAYATTNSYEFLAQAMSDPKTQAVLARMPASPGFGGRFSNALREVLNAIKTILKGDSNFKSKTALDELMWSVDLILTHRRGGLVGIGKGGMAANVPEWPGNTPDLTRVVSGMPSDPAVFQAARIGLINPVATVRSRRRHAERMVQHAKAWLRDHPIDEKRLSTVTDKLGLLSDGLVLAKSKHPIVKMISGLLVETTTGASGRGPSAAIRKEMVATKIRGNVMLDYENAYTDWKRSQGQGGVKGVWDDLSAGRLRRQFDDLVTQELLARRAGGQGPQGMPQVVHAANALEAMYDRARVHQQESGVLGADALGATSRGYYPQQLSGEKLAGATAAQIDNLVRTLASHWETSIGWNASFAKEFAAFYVDRARARAMGRKGIDPGVGTHATDVIRDTLLAMQDAAMDPAAISTALKQLATASQGGQGHTKHRLEVPMELESVRQWYETDQMSLAARYINRASGTIALTEFGVHGPTGVRHLREATMTALDGVEVPTKEELDAFDRVTTELLGQPVAGEVVSRAATNLRLTVGLQRLGGMGFVQAAETMNLAAHLGLGSLLNGIASIPRLMGEVGRLKAGRDPASHLLTHIEDAYGEFGAGVYKIHAPLDPPDSRLNSYVRDSGVLARVLQGGQFIQSKLSMFRAVMAVQHRMVAEQILLKAVRLIQSADVSPAGVMFTNAANYNALRDMGFTDELLVHFAQNLSQVARFYPNGKLESFDITKIPNPKAADAFVQAMHRGVSQIIQGTYVGERSKWLHNDYVQLLAQLRTFSLTAAEKQWSRQRMNHGYAAAAGMLAAQMALVLPVHLARVHAASLGRDDREKFVQDNLKPAALVRATLNYTSMSGLLGDAVDLTASVAGGWGGKEVKETLTGRTQRGANSPLSAIPVLGSIEQASKMATGQTTVYNAMKQMPFSNLPGLVQAINLLRE